MESYHANEARLKMRDILTSVERGEHVEIKRYDTPTAIVVPVEWYEHQRAALAAFAEAGMSGDVPVSAVEVRNHVVTLAALLDGFRKYAFTPEGIFRDYWDKLNEAVVKLADLLPENAED
jgi:antitoxin (DNA-binding transcriptional repressor) of toxin-antitoxin stability system